MGLALEEEEDMVKTSKVENSESIEKYEKLIISFAQYCVIYREFAPAIIFNRRSDLSRRYKTSLGSFPHLLGSIYKSNLNCTGMTSFTNFHQP